MICWCVSRPTPLLKACRLGHIDVIQRLLRLQLRADQHGPSVCRARDAHGQGALHYAATAGNEDMVRLLRGDVRLLKDVFVRVGDEVEFKLRREDEEGALAWLHTRRCRPPPFGADMRCTVAPHPTKPRVPRCWDRVLATPDARAPPQMRMVPQRSAAAATTTTSLKWMRGV